MYKRAAIFPLLALCSLAGMPAQADALDDIRERGILNVGVKTDYRPFGFRDGTGEVIGFDADVAASLAEIIGVPVNLIAVSSANRLQKLAGGEVDVVVATLADTIERRRLVRMVEPAYYGGGASVLVPEESAIHTWEDVRGKQLCAVQGALWNRLAASRLLAGISAFGTTGDAELALREGNCAGFIYDEAALWHRLDSGDWPGYRMLPVDFVAPWTIAVAQDGPLANLLDETMAEWLRNGHLVSLEAKWSLRPSPYLREAAVLWSKRDNDGQWHCRRQADGRWTPDCRDLALLKAPELQGFGSMILGLRDNLGLDLTPFYDDYSRNLFLKAMLLTALLSVGAAAGSLLIGAGGAVLLRTRVPGLGRFAAAVFTFVRMTPPLLQLYLVFFGIGGLLVAQGVAIGAIPSALAVLSLYAGAANAHAIADAAAALPANARDRLRRIATLSYPAVMGSCVNIVKATAMASAIAVPELVHSSTAIIADYGNSAIMMNILLVCYVTLVFLVVKGFTLVERRVLHR